MGLTSAALLLTAFGWLSLRRWRAQPGAVRWRLRAERREAAVALWPVLVVAAAVGLTVHAWRPPLDSFAEQVGALAAAVAFGTFAIRCRNLLAGLARVTLVRLGHRTGLAGYRVWAGIRGRAGRRAAGRAGG